MKKISLALLFTLISFNASATYESLCWDNDCKTLGWTEKSDAGELDYQCLRESCDANGIVKGNFNDGTYIICKNAGCNAAGFYEIKRSNQIKISETVCNSGDCSKFGSVNYSSKGILTLSCRDNDCAHSGWISTINGLVSEEVVCLKDDCEHVGWRNIR